MATSGCEYCGAAACLKADYRRCVQTGQDRSVAVPPRDKMVKRPARGKSDRYTKAR